VCTDEIPQDGGAAGDAESEPGLWNNRALEICRQNAGVGKEAAFDKRLEKLAQVPLCSQKNRPWESPQNPHICGTPKSSVTSSGKSPTYQTSCSEMRT